MKLSEEQKFNILKILASDISSSYADTGSLIFSPLISSKKLVLLLDGNIRLIDQSSTFKTKTLDICKAPFLIGISNLISNNVFEEVRANSRCEFKIIDIELLSIEQINKIRSLFKWDFSPFEIIYISKLLERNTSTLMSDKYSNFIEFNKFCTIYNSSNLSNNYQQIIFMDKDIMGFKYGQFITSKICKKFFDEFSWPRLIAISSDSVNVSVNEFYTSVFFKVYIKTSMFFL